MNFQKELLNETRVLLENPNKFFRDWPSNMPQSEGPNSMYNGSIPFLIETMDKPMSNNFGEIFVLKLPISTIPFI